MIRGMVDFTKRALARAVSMSRSYSETARRLRKGSQVSGPAVKTIKKYEKIWSIDTSHFDPHWSAKEAGRKKRKPLSDILKSGTNYSSNTLKKRLIEEGILELKCAIERCPTRSMSDWCSKPITFHLDHINGVHDDNRVQNLRILCIMCHSQTTTFGGRRKKKFYYCADCGRTIDKKSTRCQSCASFHQAVYKANWPAPEVLLEEVSVSSMSAVARRLGVTPNAVKKRMKNHPVG